VDLVVAADRLAAEAEVTLLAVAAVMPQVVAAATPQVVAAEDIAVAAVRMEAVTNSYFHADNERRPSGRRFHFSASFSPERSVS
jgi:hypothetical protein